MKLSKNNGIWTLCAADGLIIATGAWDYVQGVMKSWTH